MSESVSSALAAACDLALLRFRKNCVIDELLPSFAGRPRTLKNAEIFSTKKGEERRKKQLMALLLRTSVGK